VNIEKQRRLPLFFYTPLQPAAARFPYVFALRLTAEAAYGLVNPFPR